MPAFRSPERQSTERAPEIGRETPARDVAPLATGERDHDEELRRRRGFDEQRVGRDAVRDRVRAQPAHESHSEREPKRDYKRDPERRADRREERREERERLYAEFRAERSRGDERRETWDDQRASERARYAEITARKVEYRRELRETGLAPQIAASLAAFRAAQARAAFRAAPSVARVCN